MKTYYFDNAATTRVDDDVAKIVYKYNGEFFYNPSANYLRSVETHNKLEESRKRILSSLRGGDGRLIFLSSGTEADNQAIFCSKKKKRSNVVISASEHPAVYNAALQLKNSDFEVRVAPVDGVGRVVERSFLSLIDENTSFVSVMHVNNETGGINDISSLVQKAKEINPLLLFHSDGVQAFGKVPVRLSDLGVDFYTISGHKIGAPKGIAALYVRRGVALSSLLFGGGQEFGLRSSTENLSGVMSFAFAAERAVSEQAENDKKYRMFADILRGELSSVEEIKWISDENASSHILTFAFKSVRGEVMQHSLEESGVLIGTGSACSARHSHERIPRALGLGEYSDGLIRISFGRETETEEVSFLAQKLKENYNILKKYVGK